MRYYKHIRDGYIDYIGTGDGAGTDITEEEYNTILTLFNNKPKDTYTHYYVLNAVTLEYEAVERPEPIPIPEPTYTLDEAAQTLAEEAGLDGYDV